MCTHLYDIARVALTVLGPKRVDAMAATIAQEADKLIDRFLSAGSRPEGVPTIKQLQFESMNVILLACLGISASSLEDPLFSSVVGIVDKTVKLAGPENDISTFLPILSFMDWLVQRNKTFLSFIDGQRNPLFRRLIAEALQKEDDNLVKTLYGLKDEHSLEDDDIMVLISKQKAASTMTAGLLELAFYFYR